MLLKPISLYSQTKEKIVITLRGEFNLRRLLKIMDASFSLNGTRTDGFRKNEPHDGYPAPGITYTFGIVREF